MVVSAFYWKKIINAEAAVVFNQICLEEDILPKYTDIYYAVFRSDIRLTLKRA
jgi:hypothetical protein